jgi:hypothetical protein
VVGQFDRIAYSRTFVQRVEPEQPVRVLDGLAERPVPFEEIGETAEDLLRTFAQPVALAGHPAGIARRQQVAAIAGCRPAQRRTVVRRCGAGRGLEVTEVDRHVRAVAPGQRARGHVNHGVQRRPVFAQVVQLASQIRQRLRVR